MLVKNHIINLLDELENEKGIDFIVMTRSQAENKLKNITNYYKVSCFKKNFIKIDSKYENLDFAALYNLYEFDVNLRECFLKMSLDLEHHLKKKIIYLIMESSNIKHISIYKRFNDYLLKKYENKKPTELFDSLFREVNIHHYDYPIYAKYGRNRTRGNLPIWVLMEKMMANYLNEFLNFYVESSLPNYKYFIPATKYNYRNVIKIRNASAHNRPLLFDICTLEGSVKRLPEHVKVRIKNKFEKESIEKISDKIKNKKFIDILSLLYLYDLYVEDEKLKRLRIDELKNTVEQFRVHKHIYERHTSLKELYSIFRQII